MLADHQSLATIPTANLDGARAFYEQTLGFKPTRELAEFGVVNYETGNGSVLLYSSEFAGTNKATVLSFDVPPDAYADEIRTLRTAGVSFETYDLPGATWEDGVARMGDLQAAWFKDPDGNIISLTSGQMT